MSQSVMRDIVASFVTDERPVDTIIAEFKEGRKEGPGQVYGFQEVDENFEPITNQWWHIGIV